jgi:HAD superfamily hydrolase (TIGR01509 family)
MFKAVIFDMDGVMIDSEPIHSLTFESVVREYGNHPILGDTGIIQQPGLSEKENWQAIMARHGFAADIMTLSEKRGRAFAELISNTDIMQKGLIALLNLLKLSTTKMAIASSSSTININVVLQVLKITHYFDAIISGDSVPRGKPFPDVFLEAARQLHIAPENCVVLEDSQTGVMAGKAAGMKVVAIPSRYTQQQDFSMADLVIYSLDDITIKKLELL